MTDVVELSSEQAFNAYGFRVTTSDGDGIEMETVGSDVVHEDVRINGKYGGRRQYTTLEGNYDGPSGEGTYVFHAAITEEKGRDKAEIHISLASTFAESGEDEPIDVVSIEAMSEDQA